MEVVSKKLLAVSLCFALFLIPEVWAVLAVDEEFRSYNYETPFGVVGVSIAIPVIVDGQI